jgi:hypothetical protein
LGRRLAHAFAAFSNFEDPKPEPLGNVGLVPPEVAGDPDGEPNPPKPFFGILTPCFLRHDRYALVEALLDEEGDLPEPGDVVEVFEGAAPAAPPSATTATARPTVKTPRRRLGCAESRARQRCQPEKSPMHHRPRA